MLRDLGQNANWIRQQGDHAAVLFFGAKAVIEAT